jgi:hypothetical protein
MAPAPPVSEIVPLTLAEIRGRDAALDRPEGLRLKPNTLSGNGVVVSGLEGHLFISNGANRWERQYLGELTVDPSWLRAWAGLLAGRQEAARERGATMWNIVAPEKQAVLPELRWPAPLPDGERRPLRRLQAETPAGANLLYAGDALAAAKSEGPVYFRRNSHWTPYGCCVAALALARRLGAAADPEHVRFGYQTQITAHDLPPHLFEAPPQEPAGVLAPLHGYVFEERPFAATGRFTGSRFGIRNPDAPDHRRLVLFGDSFSYDAGFAAALSSLFAEVTFIWSKDVLWDEATALGAEVVVWESAERFIATVPKA